MRAARIRAALSALGIVTAFGCHDAGGPRDPLATTAAELDAAVTASVEPRSAAAARATSAESRRTNVAAARIRQDLGHRQPEVRALAAQAAGAAGDWESMPRLLELLDDADVVVRARASVACAHLIGMDFGHDPQATPAERAAKRAEIAKAYAAMRANPPPQYRRERQDGM